MFTLRLCGGMPETSASSSRILPAVGCSKPAISRSVVVLPQPDGPSSEKNSPLAIVQVDVVDRGLGEALRQRDQLDLPTSHVGYLPFGRGSRSAPAPSPARVQPEPQLVRDELHA